MSSLNAKQTPGFTIASKAEYLASIFTANSNPCFINFNHEKVREFDDNFRVVGIERYRFAILIFGLDEFISRCKLPGDYQVGACSLIDCKNDFMKRRRKKTT
jgi:hypothetical protein